VKTWQIVLLVIIAILLIALIALYFLGKRLQKKKEESYLEHMYYHQDIMMHITKKHNKFVH